MRAALTRKRLEAIVYSIGQTLAGASELEVKRTDLVLARAWAEDALKKRKAKAERRRAAVGPSQYSAEQRSENSKRAVAGRQRDALGNFTKVAADG